MPRKLNIKMTPIFFILCFINALAFNGFGTENPPKEVDINIPIASDIRQILRGKRYAPCNGLNKRNYTSINTNLKAYPGYNRSNGPATNGYRLTPGYNVNLVSNSTPKSQYPGRNIYYNNGSRPGNTLYNNSRFGFNNKPGYSNYSSYTPRPGNNTALNLQPSSMPYPGFNRGYLASNNTKPSNSYLNTTPIPGYRPKPGTNALVPINNNVKVPYKPGNTTMSCNRCKKGVSTQNSTITKVEATMDACVVICNDCPTGTKRVGRYCVPDVDSDEE